MRSLGLLISPVLVALAGVSAAQAGEKKVLAGGAPPLTEDMVGDYAKFAEWRWGVTLARVGGRDRFRQMVINTWINGDKGQKEVFLAGLKWWREEYPKLSAALREGSTATGPGARRDVERSLRSAANTDAIHRLQLNLSDDARQREILGISAAAAKGHETNMRIIEIYGGRGRYEYNPTTGRYDRYVP